MQALQDPVWERTGHTVKGRDGCRVPLPWTRRGSSFGFSSNGSWLPQPESFGDCSVQEQDGDPGSTLAMYRCALGLRRRFPTTDSAVHWLDRDTPDLLHFRRSNGWECLVNFSAADFPLPPGQVLISSNPLIGGRLPPETTVWLDMAAG